MSDTAYLRRLIRADMGAAEDNLYRAKLAARVSDPTQAWGESGQTLQSIIEGYEAWLNKARQELEGLK